MIPAACYVCRMLPPSHLQETDQRVPLRTAPEQEYEEPSSWGPAGKSKSAPGSPPAPALPPRLVSLDAYRGFVMLLMMAGLTASFTSVARALPGVPVWAFLAHHQSHVDWVGCSLHDLIQPSFSFIVGVALPFSIAARMARGQTMGKLTLHAAWRSVLLVAIGIFLRSVDKPRTLFEFTDTLIQIGFGYTFLFLLGFRSVRAQWIAFALLLIGDWLVFAFYPLPGAGFDYAAVGVKPEWFAQHGLHGFEAHWNMNSNAAWAFDVWFLNLFPRGAPFAFNPGATATLNFIPTLATMILGLIAGEALHGKGSMLRKTRWLIMAGVITLAAGWGIGALGVCPLVKKLWTPSWVLYSGGWSLLLMALFYLVIDVGRARAWCFPLLVIGLNSIAAYCMVHLMNGFIRSSLKTHLGQNAFRILGKPYETFLLGSTTLLVLWLMLLWMYRRKVFLRI
jgi:heparan-alpha-glucosaminide N-acetyltransferase